MKTSIYIKYYALFLALFFILTSTLAATEKNISNPKFLSGLWKIEESAPALNPVVYLAITRDNAGIRYTYTEDTSSSLDYCYVTERFDIKALGDDKFQFVMTETQEALNSFTAIRDKSTITMTSEKRVTFLEFVAQAEPAFVPCDEKAYVSLVGRGHKWSLPLPVDKPEPNWSDDTSDIAGTWILVRNQFIVVSIFNDAGEYTGVFLERLRNGKIECGVTETSTVRHDGNGSYFFSDDFMFAHLVLQKSNDQLHFKQYENMPGEPPAAIVLAAKKYVYPNDQLPDCL